MEIIPLCITFCLIYKGIHSIIAASFFFSAKHDGVKHQSRVHFPLSMMHDGIFLSVLYTL